MTHPLLNAIPYTDRTQTPDLDPQTLTPTRWPTSSPNPDPKPSPSPSPSPKPSPSPGPNPGPSPHQVAEFFQRQWGIQLQLPHLPCLLVGKVRLRVRL